MCKAQKHKLLPQSDHGPLEKVFENIWVVKGNVKMPMIIPMKIARTMTIIRNPQNREIIIINSMRVSPQLLEEIENLGPIKHIITLGSFHGRDDGVYRERYGATIYVPEGFVYNRKMGNAPTNPEDGYMQPDVYISKDSKLPLPDATVYNLPCENTVELLIRLDRNGGILLSCDALQNTPKADEFVNLPAKIMMKKMGFYKPYNLGPGWVSFAKPKLSAIRSILDIDFQHVLMGHGDPVIDNAKEKYRPVLEGEVKGCHGEIAT